VTHKRIRLCHACPVTPLDRLAVDCNRINNIVPLVLRAPLSDRLATYSHSSGHGLSNASRSCSEACSSPQPFWPIVYAKDYRHAIVQLGDHVVGQAGKVDRLESRTILR
jgi:hypothetical protein